MTRTNNFEIDATFTSGRRLITVKGELDLAVSPQLERALLDAVAATRAGDGVVLDMEQVDFFDSSGLRTLVNGARAAAASDIHLLINASKAVLQVFELAGVNAQSVPAIRLEERHLPESAPLESPAP